VGVDVGRLCVVECLVGVIVCQRQWSCVKSKFDVNYKCEVELRPSASVIWMSALTISGKGVHKLVCCQPATFHVSCWCLVSTTQKKNHACSENHQRWSTEQKSWKCSFYDANRV
jgi:hypothetical protein